MPAALATWMLSVDDIGPMGDSPLPYATGVATTLTAVALAYVAVRRLVGDVAIRPAAG